MLVLVLLVVVVLDVQGVIGSPLLRSSQNAWYIHAPSQSPSNTSSVQTPSNVQQAPHMGVVVVVVLVVVVVVVVVLVVGWQGALINWQSSLGAVGGGTHSQPSLQMPLAVLHSPAITSNTQPKPQGGVVVVVLLLVVHCTLHGGAKPGVVVVGLIQFVVTWAIQTSLVRGTGASQPQPI